MGIAMAIH